MGRGSVYVAHMEDTRLVEADENARLKIFIVKHALGHGKARGDAA